MIRDRDPRNIILSETNFPSSVFFDEKYWKVVQIDLADVYDAVEDTSGINLKTNLTERKGKVKLFKNPARTISSLAMTTNRIAESIRPVEAILRATEKEKKYLQKIHAFILGWDSRVKSSWISDEDLSDINLDNLEDLFSSISIEKN